MVLHGRVFLANLTVKKLLYKTLDIVKKEGGTKNLGRTIQDG